MYRVAFKLGLMVFNCLHNQAPQCLVDLCQSVSSVASRQHLRSASRCLLVVPRHRLSSYGRRAFCGRPCDMELVTRQSERSGHQQTPSSVHWRRFYFQLTRVHSALELFGRRALQIYLLTYLLTEIRVYNTLLVCRYDFREHNIGKSYLLMSIRFLNSIYPVHIYATAYPSVWNYLFYYVLPLLHIKAHGNV